MEPNEPGFLPAELRIATDGDMRDLGRRLAALLRAGDLVILAGPLGAGKTTLVQGIGAGLGVRGPVTSPTFVIARVHPPLAGGVISSGARPGTFSSTRAFDRRKVPVAWPLASAPLSVCSAIFPLPTTIRASRSLLGRKWPR